MKTKMKKVLKWIYKHIFHPDYYYEELVDEAMIFCDTLANEILKKQK